MKQNILKLFRKSCYIALGAVILTPLGTLPLHARDAVDMDAAKNKLDMREADDNDAAEMADNHRQRGRDVKKPEDNDMDMEMENEVHHHRGGRDDKDMDVADMMDDRGRHRGPDDKGKEIENENQNVHDNSTETGEGHGGQGSGH